MDFTRGDIPRQIRLLAIPASVGFFFHTMFNVVDAFFAGLISTDALAAMSISFPVFFIIIAFASGLGTGATALISNKIGRGQSQAAQHIGAQAISSGLFLSVFLTALGISVAPKMFQILGAEGEYLALTLDYTNVIFYGSVFFVIEAIFNSILSAHGDTKTFRNFLIGGFLLNLILDPLLLFGGFGIPALGLTGVALATVIIQIIGSIYVGYKIIRGGYLKDIRIKDFYPQLRTFLKLAKQGLPASLNMLTIAIGFFVITLFVKYFGKEAVAAFGIITRIEQIIVLPAIGLNMAVLTLVGQNNGAYQFERIQKVIHTALKYGLAVVGCGAIVVWLFPEFLMDIFSDDTAVISLGAPLLKIAALIELSYVILHLYIAALQGMKKPLFAFWSGVIRQAIIPIVLFGWIAIHVRFGITAIWWTGFVMNWSAALITVLYTRLVLKKLTKLSEKNL